MEVLGGGCWIGECERLVHPTPLSLFLRWLFPSRWGIGYLTGNGHFSTGSALRVFPGLGVASRTAQLGFGQMLDAPVGVACQRINIGEVCCFALFRPVHFLCFHFSSLVF